MAALNTRYSENGRPRRFVDGRNIGERVQGYTPQPMADCLYCGHAVIVDASGPPRRRHDRP